MARTVAEGTITQTLINAQQATKRKPYVRVYINSVDYSSRVLTVEHHEEAYRDYATIILNNSDRGLDSVSTATTNLLGYRFRIGYGYVTGVGNEYSESADLYVKSQQLISSPGQLLVQLYCEGQWMLAREKRLMAYAGGMQVGDPDDVEDDPYFIGIFEGTKTVYELIKLAIEALGFTLEASPSPDDGILNNFHPVYSLEELPEAAVSLRDLIQMTKCYLFPRANLTWKIVYPQDADSANETFYSYQSPYFYEYAESLNLVIPNRIVVFAGNPDNLPEWPTPVIVGDTGAYSGNYTEILEPHLELSITKQADAQNRANAILTRYKAEGLAGYAIVPHDCRVELYDKLEIDDKRGH